MKKVLAVLLTLCVVMCMLPVMALAATTATLNVTFVNDSGTAVSAVSPNQTVWAVVSLSGYSTLIGNSSISYNNGHATSSSTYDRTVGLVSAYINADSDVFAIAEQSNAPVWSSPYKTDMVNKGGELSANQDGDVIKTMLYTDNYGGFDYCITKNMLDSNNGELFRIKLTVKSSAPSGTYTVGANGGDSLTVPGIAVITRASGASQPTISDLPLSFAGNSTLTVSGGGTPSTPTSDPVTVLDDYFTTAANWTGSTGNLTGNGLYQEWTYVDPTVTTTQSYALGSHYTIDVTTNVGGNPGDGWGNYISFTYGDFTVVINNMHQSVELYNGGSSIGSATLSQEEWAEKIYTLSYDNGTVKVLVDGDAAIVSSSSSSVQSSVISVSNCEHYRIASVNHIVATTYPTATACQHTSTEVRNAVAATCGASGYSGDTYCRDCGTKLATGSVTSPTGNHSTEVRNATAATCTVNGYTGDTWCRVCNTKLSTGTSIPKTGHDTEVRGAVAATCVSNGYTGDTWCKKCNTKISTGTSIPKGSHVTEVRGAKAATCGEDGYTGDTYCTICQQKLSTGSVIYATDDHSWGGWVIVTPATAGQVGIKQRTCSVCGATDSTSYTSTIGGTTGACTWSLDGDTLTIMGNGATADYSNVDTAPWKEYRVDIKHIVIDNGVTYVGNRAFKGLNKVVDVTFGKDVVSTGYECFFGCTSLASVTLNEGLEKLNALMFYNCGFTSIEIPSTVTNIANRAFKACSKLKTIDIPDSVTYLGYEVFMSCTSLTSAEFTTGAAYLNSVMFSGCTALQTFTVPANITMIRSNAFANCTALTSVIFEDDDYLTATASEAAIASNAFTGHNANLTLTGWYAGKAQTYANARSIRFEAKNTSEFIYTTNSTGITITGMRGNGTAANIPSTIDGYSVTEIGSGAFRDSAITSVTIPNTVKTIGGRAFQGSKITSVTVPSSVKTINYSAFQGCTSLTYINVRAATTTVNSTAFTGCTNATVYTTAGSAADKAAAAQGIRVSYS